MEVMPLARLASRLIAEEKRFKEEEERRAQDIIFQGYVTARVVVSSLIQDKPLPQTKAEQKRDTPETKILEAKNARKEHDSYFQWGLQGLQHFASWFGMPVWGEPEDKLERELSPKEKAESIREWQEAALTDFIESARKELGHDQ